MIALTGALSGANLIMGVWQLSLNHVLIGVTDLVIGVLIGAYAISQAGR